MTFSGWAIFVILTIVWLMIGWLLWYKSKVAAIVVAGVLTLASLGGLIFYFNCTASGRREVVDERSELNNGLEREINVYTADGNLIAHYEGKIDLEDNEGGYVIFDYEGKRYTYYNCFVESIADIYKQ